MRHAVVLAAALALLLPVSATSGRPTRPFVVRAVGAATRVDLERAAAIMRRRLVLLGIRPAVVRLDGRDRLRIELPRRFADPRVEALLVKTGHVTRDEWVRGKLRNSPQHFAIVLDGEIKSFPQIDYTDNSLSHGIGGGSAQIVGLASPQEAKDLALVLQTGALPVRFVAVKPAKR